MTYEYVEGTEAEWEAVAREALEAAHKKLIPSKESEFPINDDGDEILRRILRAFQATHAAVEAGQRRLYTERKATVIVDELSVVTSALMCAIEGWKISETAPNNALAGPFCVLVHAAIAISHAGLAATQRDLCFFSSPEAVRLALRATGKRA